MKFYKPFFFTLFLLMVLGLIIPLRPKVSMEEKRELAKFPEITASSLISGEFFKNFDNWYSDTFIGRSGWIAVSNRINSFHGISTDYINLSAIKEEQDNESSENNSEIEKDSMIEAEQSNREENNNSHSEKNDIAITENSTTENAIEETDSVDDVGEIDKMYTGAIIVSGNAYAIKGFSETASLHYAKLCNNIADTLADKNIRFYTLPAPTGIGIMLDEKLLDQVGSANQNEILSFIDSNTEDNVNVVDSFNMLSEHKNEYIYFSSDHHWTALGAYYAYTAFCQKAGFSPVSLDEYTEIDMGRFKGSYYFSMANNNKLNPDTLIAYSPPGNCRLYLINKIDNTIYEEDNVIVDYSDKAENNKYNAFIKGDNAISVIENNSIPDAPVCVVLKDSFGNPFSVYLSQHYSKVYVVDYRKVMFTISSFAEKVGAQDVIVCQSIAVSQSEKAIKILDTVLK